MGLDGDSADMEFGKEYVYMFTRNIEMMFF